MSPAIELLGKFKENDWWIHNGEVQIGVFASLAEPFEDDSAKLAEYEEESDPEVKQSE